MPIAIQNYFCLKLEFPQYHKSAVFSILTGLLVRLPAGDLFTGILICHVVSSCQCELARWLSVVYVLSSLIIELLLFLFRTKSLVPAGD